MATPTTPLTKTIVITGISPHSPLSTYITAQLISSAQTPLNIALLGPSQPHLEQVASKLQAPNITILPLEVDLTSAQSVGIVSHDIRCTLGAWDVFVHNAPAHLPEQVSTTVRGSDEDDWWSVFEVNVRSLHFVARHFFSKMRAGATFVNILGRATGEELDERVSALTASAVAAERVVRYLDGENDTVQCSSVYVEQSGEKSEDIWKDGAERFVRLLA